MDWANELEPIAASANHQRDEFIGHEKVTKIRMFHLTKSVIKIDVADTNYREVQE